mgnify:CR=1 FL=1
MVLRCLESASFERDEKNDGTGVDDFRAGLEGNFGARTNNSGRFRLKMLRFVQTWAWSIRRN